MQRVLQECAPAQMCEFLWPSIFGVGVRGHEVSLVGYTGRRPIKVPYLGMRKILNKKEREVGLLPATIWLMCLPSFVWGYQYYIYSLYIT